MHPPLFRPHPQCHEIIELLVKCHDTSPVLKYFGACNNLKAAMDNCLRSEKDVKRKANLIKARELDQLFEKKLSESKKN